MLGMKHPVKRFRNLTVALKEIEPFVRNGQHLLTGRGFKSFGDMRSREALANWLICVAINSTGKRSVTFASDPIQGDGIIIDVASEETWPTEHVMVPPRRNDQPDNTQSRILEAITNKRKKGGGAYAKGKTLIVFLGGKGSSWQPNKVARALPTPLHFSAVWVVALQCAEEAGPYTYAVTLLDINDGNAPIILIQIEPDFTAWSVERVQ
ncbi:MAG: hypothetical protein RIC85_03005 [Gammaproteobacteria bacterium]